MTPEQELRLAAKALDYIEFEPKTHVVDGQLKEKPSEIWRRYMKAYMRWIRTVAN